MVAAAVAKEVPNEPQTRALQAEPTGKEKDSRLPRYMTCTSCIPRFQSRSYGPPIRAPDSESLKTHSQTSINHLQSGGYSSEPFKEGKGPY